MFPVGAIYGNDDAACVVPEQEDAVMEVMAQRVQDRKEQEEKMAKRGSIIADAVKADGGGLRYNAVKNRIELVPPEWIWAVADVTTKGSYKYDERNWERGMKWSIMIGCVGRHIAKFLIGERYDAETGCHHLAMAAWNILALMSYDIRNIGEKDLPGVDTRLSTGGTILDRVNNGLPTHPVIREAMGLPELEEGT
jgi:hypothetical protein